MFNFQHDMAEAASRIRIVIRFEGGRTVRNWPLQGLIARSGKCSVDGILFPIFLSSGIFWVEVPELAPCRPAFLWEQLGILKERHETPEARRGP